MLQYLKWGNIILTELYWIDNENIFSLSDLKIADQMINQNLKCNFISSQIIYNII